MVRYLNFKKNRVESSGFQLGLQIMVSNECEMMKKGNS
jgi:hypothetical protein